MSIELLCNRCHVMMVLPIPYWFLRFESTWNFRRKGCTTISNSSEFALKTLLENWQLWSDPTTTIHRNIYSRSKILKTWKHIMMSCNVIEHFTEKKMRVLFFFCLLFWLCAIVGFGNLCSMKNTFGFSPNE